MPKRSEPTERTRRFVKNLRALRYQRGWSAQDLEDRLAQAALSGVIEVGIPRAVIANLENNRRASITLDEAMGIAVVLNTTLGWLCDYDGPACTHCSDNPPEGFACKVCKADADLRFKPYVEPKEERGE